MPIQWTDITSDDRWLALEEEDKEAIRQDYFDSVIAPSVPSFAIDNMRQEFDDRTSRSGKGLLNDAVESAYTGFQEMGFAVRELAGHVSPKAVEWLDSVDEWMHGVKSEELLESNIERAYADMSPRMQEAMKKEWWDEEEERLGLAASDPYAYVGNIARSAPEIIASMLPAVKIGKMIYGTQIAKGAAESIATAKAATGAQIAGSVLEGAMAGGHASRGVRQELEALPDDVWENSDVYQELIASGMEPDEAKANIMDSSATQAMLTAGAVTAAFGGQGDRVLTQGILRGLKGGIARRIGVGAAAEASEEFPQEYGSQVAENIAVQNVDPTRETYAGALSAGIGGAAAGGPMGAAFGAVTRQAPAEDVVQPPAPDPITKIPEGKSIDEVVDATIASTEVVDQNDSAILQKQAFDAEQLEAERRTREFLEREQAQAAQATEPTAMQLALERAGAVPAITQEVQRRAETIPEDQRTITQERQQPEVSKDIGQQDRKLAQEEGRQATYETPQKAVGQAQRVAGTESVVADTRRLEGVDYELYQPVVADGKWSTRITDVDSGEVVGITQHPTQEAAIAAHRLNVGDQGKLPGIEPGTEKEDPRLATSRRMKDQIAKERVVNPERDDLLSAIAKNGGISREDAEANGIDPADFGRRGWRIQRVFTKGGASFDGMAQSLSQDGYPVTDEGGNYTPNELLSALNRALLGDKVYSTRAGDAAMEEMAGREPDYGDMEPVADELADVVEEYDFTENQRGIASVLFEAEALLGEVEAQRIVDAHDTDEAAVAALEEALETNEKQRLSGSASRTEAGEEARAKQEELLQSYTEEDIRARDQAKDAERQAEQAEDAKARADEQREGFLLTGSDLEADELAARGQKSLLSYLGPKAATADLSALKRAAEMDQVGVPADQIREETGWFLGMDDMWRFEVSDDVMTLRKDAKTRPGKPGAPHHWLLGDLVDHPQLFEAYPELRDVKVETTPGIGVGNYNPDTNTIGVSHTRRREVLAHEIQHIIQRIEEFARGGSISAMSRPEHEAEINKEYQRGEAKRHSDMMNQAIMDDDVDAATEHRDTASKYAIFQAYQRLAGEIEARDTQARINMTAKDRERLDPYTTEGIPKEEAILQFKTEGIEEGAQLVTTTPKILKELERDFGKANVKKMMDSGLLFIEDDTPRGIPEGAGGSWDGYAITLYADNLVSAGDGIASAVLTHEGEHAGMRTLIGNSYDALQKRLDNLIKAGDATAIAAVERVPGETAPEFVQAERLAYFIEESFHRVQAKKAVSGRARNLFRSLLNAIKAWFRQTGFGQALANAGIDWKLTDDYAVALAHRALQRAAEAKAAGEQLPVPGETQFSEQSDAALERARAKIAPKRTLRDAIDDVMLAPRDFMQEKWDRIEQGVFDRFHGLLMAEKAAGDIPKDRSAYVATRLSTSLQDIVAVLLRHGKLHWEGNILQTETNREGFLEVLAPVADRLEEFGMYLVGLRANDLMTMPQHQGKNIEDVTGFDQESVDAMVALGDETFQDVQKKYIEFNKSILDVATDAGLIKPETRAVWESDMYLPFFRVMEEGGVAMTPRSKGGVVDQSSGIKRLKGSTKAIGDPLQNILANWTHLLDASLKNNAARQAVDNLIGSGVIERKALEWKPKKVSAEEAKKKVIQLAQDQGLDPEAWDILSSAESLEGLADLFALEAPAGKNIIRIMRDGKPEYYEVFDDLLLRSLTNINQQSWGKMMNIFRTPKRWLTTMVTAAPDFMMRNFTRDTLSAWVLGRDKFIPAIDGAKGVVKAWNEDQDMVRLMAAGGTFTSGGYLNAHDPTSLSRFIKAELKHPDFEKTVLNTPRRLWDFWQRVGSAAENGNRVAVAMAAKGADKSTIEQAFEAKDLMDFSMRGDYVAMQLLAETVPFMSARIQGLHRLGRGLAEDPRNFALKGSMITMAALALWFRNKDDERYKELEEWDRDTYFHFFVGDEHFRLPKPFEVGMIFGTVPERMADSLSGERGWDVFFERLAWNTKETLSMTPIPQTIAPMVEQWANKSTFTGRPIVGLRLTRLAPEAQYEPWTSETLRVLGDAIGQSPKRMESLVRGYFGTMGTYILGASDMVTRNLFNLPEHPEKSLDEYPIVRSFYRGDETGRYTRYTTEMYELLRELNQAHYAVLKFREDGDEENVEELQDRYGSLFQYRKMLNKRSRELSKLNKKIRRTHISKNLSPSRKKEIIDGLVRQRNKITSTAMKKIPD